MAKLRRQAEPQSAAALERFTLEWQGVGRRRNGADSLIAVIEQLQGAPIPASVLETEILSARLDPYRSGDLDLLCAAGEVVWCGIEATGERDGRVALYLPDLFPVLAPLPRAVADKLPRRILEVLGGRGASFFAEISGKSEPSRRPRTCAVAVAIGPASAHASSARTPM